MSKSGGVFQFSGGRMTSRGQCPRGGVLVNVFTPPPLGNPVSAPAFDKSYFFWRASPTADM